jgi:hypothetical protein
MDDKIIINIDKNKVDNISVLIPIKDLKELTDFRNNYHKDEITVIEYPNIYNINENNFNPRDCLRVYKFMSPDEFMIKLNNFNNTLLKNITELMKIKSVVIEYNKLSWYRKIFYNIKL